MNVKELFDKAENGVLSWEQFETAAKNSNAKFVDLNEGNYVSKHKYDDDISSRDNQITTLNSTISTRDKDLNDLKTQLKNAGTDATKLSDLTAQFDTLKSKYDTDTKAFKDQLRQQAYEFAVKDFANGKKFTSNAAKRDFIQSMIAKNLKIENDRIIGADDFVSMYSEANADAFVVEQPKQEEPKQPKPTFAQPTNPIDNKETTPDFGFNFIGVRQRPKD